MRIIEGSDFLTIYKNLLLSLLKENEITIRNNKCYEIINCSFKTNDSYNIICVIDKKSMLEYLAGELFWYMTGDNSVNTIKSFSKFWCNICNDDYTCNSAYGNLLFKNNDNIPENNQWSFACKTLLDDKNSRRAFLQFQRPRFQNVSSKDIPCTMYIMYHIRNDKLHTTIHMRSSDVRRGIIYDIPFFSILHINMLHILRNKYDIVLGDLEFMANSIHLYSTDYSFAAALLQSDEKKICKYAVDDKFVMLDENGYVDYKKLLSSVSYLLSESNK